jgi:hypothetical protein
LEQFHALFRPTQFTPLNLSLDAVLADRRPTWEEWFARAGRCLTFQPPPRPATGAIDPARLSQALDGLASWRSDAGGPDTEDRVSWREDQGHLHLRWEGPKGRDAPPCGPCFPLALPLLGRFVAAHGGTIDVHLKCPVRISLRWPREPPSGRAGGVPTPAG